MEFKLSYPNSIVLDIDENSFVCDKTKRTLVKCALCTLTENLYFNCST